MNVVTPKRCAIYTRKSSEEGLDQRFNSLDAQREAAEAYIFSQQHEGWRLSPERYDDGGFSGGNTERPALQRLLTDIAARQIDVVVVYKVDRLSRSLNDFAKMMDLFDQHKVSFVSIAQHFNTTHAKGRLTLNVLLSFAQFEREVTSERIRDKIALSKQKGLWMGGRAPLGYDIDNRQLVVNVKEVQLVKRIFSRFIELGSMTLLCRELKAQGHRTKTHRDKDGRTVGGILFSKTTLYKLLHQRLYLGEVAFKGQTYPGQHEAIIEQSLWDAAHALLKQGPNERVGRSVAATPAPSKGLFYGPDDKPMLSTHSKKLGKRYRYYVTHTAHKYGRQECPIGQIRAGDIEGIVFDQLKVIFKQPQLIVAVWKTQSGNATHLTEQQIRQQLMNIESLWDQLFHNEQARLLQLFIQRITVTEAGLNVQIRTNGLDDLVRSLSQHHKKMKATSATQTKQAKQPKELRTA